MGLHFDVLYKPNVRERIRTIAAHFCLRIKYIRTYSLKRKIVKEQLCFLKEKKKQKNGKPNERK